MLETAALMMDTKTILNFAWLGGYLLLIAALVLLWARGLHREFPWFSRYLLLILGRSPLLFLVRNDRAAYFYSYWIFEAFTVALSFLVIFEIYRHVLASTSFNMTRSTFFTLGVGLFAVAALIAMLMETADVHIILRSIFILTRTVRIVQVGLFVMLLAASLFFNFYWQSLPFGFALGYGIYACVELVATTFRTSLGPAGDNVFAVAKVLGYQLAVMTWIAFIYRNRPQHGLKTMPEESISEWLRPLERSAE
ncbi:MAG TPA: hypothetical protein VMZ25_09210 [Terriglobales bacterium]|nr:hypothetical protein [Terriglobales bacterium]